MKKILVTGATGRQGGAVIKALSGKGFHVIGLTRNTKSEGARKLQQKGIELAEGNLNEAYSLERAMEGVYGVFSVQNPWKNDVETEVEQGKRIANIAQKQGVQHLVYSSVSKSVQPSGVPHFESKGRVERYLQELELRTTVIRPVFFMEMLLPRYESNASFMWGVLKRVLKQNRRVQLISVHDIGRVAASAFAEVNSSANKVIELASDELSFQQLQSCFHHVFGKNPRSFAPPLGLLKFINKEAAINFRWIGEEGWDVDIDAAHQSYPGLLRFDDWLMKESTEAGSNQ